MADGNPYYHPRPSFFDEFSKGVGLGLSIRQASDRAKQIEINAQEQRMRMGELQRQRGVEDTMRTYANQSSPAQYAEDPGMTAEAQANPDFAGSGFTPLSVGQETAPARPQPTLQQIMEFGVRAGASPGQIKSIGDAIQMTGKGQPIQEISSQTHGNYLIGPDGKPVYPRVAGNPRDPATLEALATQQLIKGDKEGAAATLGMKPATAAERVPNLTAYQTYVSTKGRVKPPGLPDDITVPEAQEVVEKAKELQRQQISISSRNTDLDNESSLRREFNTQAKVFTEVRDMYGRVTAAAKNPSPAGDMSMIFAYMKMLDPVSVVRESEFRVAETARPLLERLGLSWDRVGSVWEGKRLTDGQRADFLNSAKATYATQEKSHKQLVGETRRIAASSGLNPDRVVTERITPTEDKAPAPKSASQPGAIPKDKMLIRDTKSGEQFLYPVGEVPEGFARIK